MSQNARATDEEEDEEWYAEQPDEPSRPAVLEDMEVVREVHRNTEESLDPLYAAALASVVLNQRQQRTLDALLETLEVIADEVESDAESALVSDVTTEDTKGEAAQVALGPHRDNVDIYYETTAQGTMTVEVSNDGQTWHQKDSQQLTDDNSLFEYDVPWRFVRAHSNQNTQKIEISAKGT